jgi:salicylate hydroxylase
LQRRAIIAGAGIGGLATAIALSQTGFSVTLYERANKLKEFGAGLQLTPNATRILSQLGILDRVLELASRPRAVQTLRGSDNAKLMRLPLDDADRRWGAPYLVIHRADLQRALVEAVLDRANVEMSLATAVVGFVSNRDRISVDLRRGATVAHDEADLFIGADGLHSQVRDRMGLGALDQADFTRRVAYRAIVDADASNPWWTRNDIVLRLGPEAHVVQYPLRCGSIINLVAIIRSAWRGGGAEDEWDGAADRSTLERAFAGWSKETRTLISAPIRWRACPLYRRPPIARFSIGRVALVGDAAHPMVPFLAQGAAQAIEDAGALGRIIAQAREVPAALAIYSRDRVARAARVQSEALKQGRIYHLSGALAFGRDVTMRMLGAHRIRERYDWLYGA